MTFNCVPGIFDGFSLYLEIIEDIIPYLKKKSGMEITVIATRLSIEVTSVQNMQML